MKLSSSLLAILALTGSVLASCNSTSKSWRDLAISAPSDGRYLSRAIGGEPFFWQADTAWELFHRLNRSDIELYLQDRASKGFNVVQAVVISELNGTTIPNFYGDLAILDSDPLQPNDAYFQHVDWAVKKAAEYGILIAMVPTWGRYINCGWHNGPVIFNESNSEAFGYYIGKRYPGLPKIIGGDSNGFWACNASAAQDAYRADPSIDQATLLSPVQDTRSISVAMVNGLKKAEAEAGYEAFVTWHPTNMYLAGQDMPYGHMYINSSSGGRASIDAVQSGHTIPDNNTLDGGLKILVGWDATKNYERINDMRAAFPGPVIDLENHYEAAHIGFNTSRPRWNASDVRHGLYNAVLSGSCGFTYGAQAIWQMYAPVDQLARPDLYIEAQLDQNVNQSWRDALGYEGAAQTYYVRALFGNLTTDDYATLQPNRSFLGTPSGSADVLAFEQNRYIAALVSSSRYLVYAGFGDAFVVDLDRLGNHFGAARATATAEWYNPRTGAYQDSSVVTLEGSQTFESPTSGDVENDWLLSLTLAA